MPSGLRRFRTRVRDLALLAGVNLYQIQCLRRLLQGRLSVSVPIGVECVKFHAHHEFVGAREALGIFEFTNNP